MDSERFLHELSDELRRIGADETVIARRIGQFEKYFATMPPEEVSEMLEGLGDIEELALGIKALSTKNKQSSESISPPQSLRSPENSSASDEVDVFSTSSRIDNSNAQIDCEKTVEFEPIQEMPHPEEETRSIDLNSLREAARTGKLPKAEGTEALYEELLEEDASQMHSEAQSFDETMPSAVEEESLLSSDNEYRHIELDFNELDDTESDVTPTAKGQAIFLVGAILTLPITLPLMLILLLAIGTVFAVISVLIAALIALLIVIVVGGVVIPLVGIIFGIIKAYTVFPVGLYEIGLGITIAGVAMFVGILVYNLAVRFLPFAMKKFGVFSRFLLRSIAKLVKRIRKECVTL